MSIQFTRWRFYLWGCLLMLAATGAGLAAAGSAAKNAREIPIDGAIGPAIGEYVVDEIQQANADHVPVIILRLDTPGGLSASMRDIVKAILASRVPVIGYVGPSGARAASAGTYILYATHIAAMAPATNLGAATPIEIGGGNDRPSPADKDKPAERSDKSNSKARNDKRDADANSSPDLSNGATERRKQVNDAVAYIRSLAERRGRNADWAEKAVRQAASLTAQQAAKQNVIDRIADNEPALLKAVDGQRVETAAGEITLHTADLAIDQRAPGWRTSLLAIISNPTVAYLLFMIGIVGLAAEALAPGATLPGTVGGISLIAALFAFHVLPVNYGGAALIVLGVLLIVAEAFVPSFGALGLGGIVAVVFGSIMLIDMPGYDVSMGVIIGIAVAAALILALMIWLFVRSRRAPIETGQEGLVGRDCVALTNFEREGRVWLHGESWQAVSEAPVVRDQTLTVTGAEGLTVYVRPRAVTTDAENPNNAGRRPEGP